MVEVVVREEESRLLGTYTTNSVMSPSRKCTCMSAAAGSSMPSSFLRAPSAAMAAAAVVVAAVGEEGGGGRGGGVDGGGLDYLPCLPFAPPTEPRRNRIQHNTRAGDISSARPAAAAGLVINTSGSRQNSSGAGRLPLLASFYSTGYIYAPSPESFSLPPTILPPDATPSCLRLPPPSCNVPRGSLSRLQARSRLGRLQLRR